MLNPLISFKIHGGSANWSTLNSGWQEEISYVASSNITTLVSLTRARARLSNDLSPTLKFEPSDSTTVSNVILPEVVSAVPVDVPTVCDNELPTR